MQPLGLWQQIKQAPTSEEAKKLLAHGMDNFKYASEKTKMKWFRALGSKVVIEREKE